MLCGASFCDLFFKCIIQASMCFLRHAMCYDLDFTFAFDTQEEADAAGLLEWWLTLKCVMHGGQNAIKRGMDPITDGDLVKSVHIKIASCINGYLRNGTTT